MVRRGFVALVVLALAGLDSDAPLTAKQRGGPSAPTVFTLTGTGQTTTPLPDGHWLLLGGQGPSGPVASAALFDPVTRQTIPLAGGMTEARAWHTATVLPDGKVLILGGIDTTGAPLATAELFDPGTETFTTLDSASASPRAGHSATLLTDGRVLVVGGERSSAELASTDELWSATGSPASLPADALRVGHTATLLGDGRVILSGGQDSRGRDANAALFSPTFNTFARVPPQFSQQDDAVFVIRESRPADQATAVPLDAFLTLRLSHPARVDTITDQSVLVTGPQGPVLVRVVTAEDGRLVFIWPAASLLDGATYTVTVSGVLDRGGVAITDASTTFRTLLLDHSNDVDPEDWIPDTSSQEPNAHRWRTNRPPSAWESLPPLVAPDGTTAISGRVLALDGRPLARVTLSMAQASTETDRTGRFLLVVGPTVRGRAVLRIQGGTANGQGRDYGYYEYGLTPTPGHTTVLPFTIWLTKLDRRHDVALPSPTVSEVVVTTPFIPGLELHIPSGTTLIGVDGKPVRRVSLTPIPLDRPPFPLVKPEGVPVYFTAQPGGAYVYTPGRSAPAGAWLVYPNYHKGLPRQRSQFYTYDPDVKGWFVYGTGRVTPDARQVVPDPRTRLYEFTGAMNYVEEQPGAKNPGEGGAANGGKGRSGDPVDTSTGIFIMAKTDLYLPDVIPLALTRTYNSGDTDDRAFGRGMQNPYRMILWSAHMYTEADLVLPDGSMVHYVRTSPGEVWWTAEYESTTTPGAFYRSTIVWNGNGWDLRCVDGTTYIFDAEMPLRAIRDKFGNTVTVDYDNVHRVTRVTSPYGRWLAFSYSGGSLSDPVTEVSDNIGRTVTYTYDGDNQLETVTDPEGGVTTYTWNNDHRLETITDGREITYLTNGYDDFRVTTQTLPSGTYEFDYTVDGGGGVTQTDVTDPRGHLERFAFNGDHYMTSHTEALGDVLERTTTIERASGSNLIEAVVDGLDRRTEYTHDTNGHVESITRLAGTAGALTWNFTYEPQFGQLAAITDPLDHTSLREYDTNGMLIEIRDPLGQSTSIARNASGQATRITDALGHQMQASYLGGDLVSFTNPLGNVWHRFVDAGGRVRSMADPLGRTTQYELDRLDRVTSRTDPLGGTVSLTYDENSNLLSLIDSLEHTTSFAYDDSDRRESRTDPMSHEDSFEYDENGNLTQHTDRNGHVTSYSYDELDRLEQVTYDDSSTITYTYDAGDRITEIDDSANGTITRTYDGLDRLTEETTAQGTVDYTYDDAGRRETMTVNGQPSVEYVYDDADRLLTITQDEAAVTFTYDDANRRSTVTLPNGIVGTYTYDNANQVTSLEYTLDSTPVGDLTYSYDAAGQRMSVGGSLARTGLPAALNSATYDAANRIDEWGGTSYTYDLNGNLTSDGTNTLSWNARNQLTGMSGGVSASFAYDGTGRRRGRTVGGTTTNFLYDGLNFVQELSGGGSPTANLLTGLGVDEVFRRTNDGGARDLLVDGLGTTLELADGSGALQTHYTFEPFGATTSSGEANSNSVQFTGREDDGSELYFYRARYYNPDLGRFLSEDSAETSPLDEVNLYAYVLDNPITFTDPFGLYTLKPGVPLPSPEIDALLNCIEAKTGLHLTVTSTTDSHAGNSPHGRGVAVDLRYSGGATAKKVLCAAGECGAGFGLDEARHPSPNATGAHIHLQIPPGRGGSRGDLPNPKCSAPGGCSK